jgi:hypothetical protein
MQGSAARPGIPLLILLASVSVCGSPESDAGSAIEISPDELQRAFLEDADAARRRFEGRDVMIEGEVAQAEARFRGTTMQGEVEVPARIAFRTALDSLPGDLDRVQVEGAFDAPEALDPWSLDPRIRIGETVRVSCPDARIRWSEPAVHVSDCRLSER